MKRLAIAVVVTLAANTIGLLAAALILDDMALDATAFVVAVAIFTAVEVVAQPLIVKLSWRYVRPVAGASALVATFLGLLVTSLLTDGLTIRGADTWLLATVIVWAIALVAALALPVLVFKRALGSRPAPSAPPPRTWGARR